MVPRLVDPHIAHAATGDMQCRAKLRFPCDRRAAQCDLPAAHVLDGTPHTNAKRTRVWKRRGYDVEASFMPGTEGQP